MPKAPFRLEAPFQPAGDQPRAIAELTAGLGRGDRFQTLATLTNQSQMGGLATNDYMVALMHLQADGLRANISVT